MKFRNKHKICILGPLLTLGCGTLAKLTSTQDSSDGDCDFIAKISNQEQSTLCYATISQLKGDPSKAWGEADLIKKHELNLAEGTLDDVKFSTQALKSARAAYFGIPQKDITFT